MGAPKALPQSHHLVSCPVKGSSTGGTSTEWVFGFLFSVFCRMKGFFYDGRIANPATTLLKTSHPTAVGRPQTQLGTRYGWPLAHKEFLHRLTGFVFNPAWCPYHTLFLTKKHGREDGLVTENPTMKQVSTGLHGTCSKSHI